MSRAITFRCAQGERIIILTSRQFLKRAQAFKLNNDVLNSQQFKQRQQYYLETLNSQEFLVITEDTDKDPLAALTDPSTNDALMNMMKGNLMNYIPQTLIMGFVNYFFAGFVVMKLPFPLTDGFKSMLQNGIQTPDLNVRYVSSISWYFVNLFGLKPVYSLLLGSAAANDLMSQQQQQNLPNLGGPGGPKADKVYRNEAENIQILNHKSIYNGILERVLEANK